MWEANSVDTNVSPGKAWEVSAKPSATNHTPASDDLRGALAYWTGPRRVEKGWSHERLAFECELDRASVSAVERSHWNVSLANIERMANALEVPAWTLLMPVEPIVKVSQRVQA